LATVVRIDLRATASGPHAMDAAAMDADTLIGLQDDAVRGRLPGPPAAGGRRRVVDVGRVLVLDDTAAFAGHAAAYQHLLLAHTIARLLCVVAGDPAEPTAIDLPPKVAAAKNAAVLWVGYPRGVGWDLEMTTTTRLVEGGTDPDGTGTLNDLAETLADPDVYDSVFGAITGMEENIAAPAVLPVLRWPALDLLRLEEEQVAGVDPLGEDPVLGPDVEQLLRDLWSYGPAVARCERLLAEAEFAVRRLPRFPGIGGRRARRAVTAFAAACAALGPAGPHWAHALAEVKDAADRLGELKQSLSLRHPVVVGVPLIMLSTGAGVVTAYGAGPGTQAPVMDAASAVVAAVVLAATAIPWWRYVTRRWISLLRLAQVRNSLEGLPAAIARDGVAMLSTAAERWYHEQRRNLVSWWWATRRAMRARLFGEVAELIRLVSPGVSGGPAPIAVQENGAAAVAADPAARVPATIADMVRLLAVGTQDRDFLQLTGVRQLPLLDGTPLGAKLVRFAPAAARQVLTDAVTERTPVAEIAWMADGESVGVLRLVPLRRGVVRGKGTAAPTAETVLAITMTGDQDGAAALTNWLSGNDKLEGRVTPSAYADDPIRVRLPSDGRIVAAASAVGDVLDCIRDADEQAEVTFTQQDDPTLTATVTATEARAASTEQEAGELTGRVLTALDLA
jgi:hypothetical protein